ncbi:MAG TPA: PAS domain S-box protein, partial [Acidimicrobiales bacterium]
MINDSVETGSPEDHPLSWRNLLEMLPDGIAIVDHDGRIRHVNLTLQTLSGFGAAELVGHQIEALIPERLRTEHAIDRAEYSEHPTTREMNGPLSFRLARRDGSEVPVDVALAPISVDGHDWIIAEVRSNDESGSGATRPYDIQQFGGAAMVSVAVALAQSEERFRLAFENNMAPMIFTDLEDRVFMANDAFCSLIGRTRDELIGFDSVPFTLPDDVGIAEDSLRSVSEGSESASLYVKRYVHKDGRVIVADVSRSPVRDSEGNIMHFVISERDITDRVKRDHMMQLLSEVNRLAIQAIDETEFLQQLCDLLVSQGDYELAWVGVATGAGNEGVAILCSAGATEYLFGEMTPWWG